MSEKYAVNQFSSGLLSECEILEYSDSPTGAFELE